MHDALFSNISDVLTENFMELSREHLELDYNIVEDLINYREYEIKVYDNKLLFGTMACRNANGIVTLVLKKNYKLIFK